MVTSPWITQNGVKHLTQGFRGLSMGSLNDWPFTMECFRPSEQNRHEEDHEKSKHLSWLHNKFKLTFQSLTPCLLVGGPDLEIDIYYYLFVLVIRKQFSKLQNYFDTSTQAMTFRLHSEFHPWLWNLVKNGVHKEINPGVKTINSYGIFDYMIFLFITNFNEVKPLRRDD